MTAVHCLYTEKYKKSREINIIYHVAIESSIGRLHTVKKSIMKFIHGFNEIPNTILAVFFLIEFDRKTLNSYGKENKSKN